MMRVTVALRLACAVLTVLFSSVYCFANVAHGLPIPQASNSGTKRGLRATATCESREVESPFVRSSALVPLPKSKYSNVFSFFTFSWVKALMEVGNRKPLELADLWVLDETQLMANASQTFDDLFTAEKRKKEWDAAVTHNNLLTDFWYSPLTRAVLKQYKVPLLQSGLLKLLNTLVQFFPSLLIARILKHVDKAAAARNLFSTAKMTVLDREGMFLALALYGVLCVKTVLENQYFDAIISIGATARGAISAAIFRKSLKLSPSGRQNNTMGEIVNYMQLDTTRMEQVIGTIHVCWDGPLQVLGYTALLLKFLGPSVFAGIAAMLVIIPFNAIYLKKLSALRAVNLKYTDARVKLTNEILQGVRAIKSYNWEKPFVEKLTAIRDLELKALEASANTRAILTSVLTAAPSMVAVVTLGSYGLLGNVLTPTKVFTALALFNQLRFPLVFLPLLLNNLAEGKVSLVRLTKFLLTDEVQDYVEREDIETGFETIGMWKDSEDAVVIENGTFSWNSNAIIPLGEKKVLESGVAPVHPEHKNTESKRGVLSNIDFKVKKGELVAVVGPVGSGKSTLLSALLGELNKQNGRVSVRGSVAYVPQSAWIPNDSLKNVVLFGRVLDRAKYDETIVACGLTKDLLQLEGGDETEIGERGVNLSGGQKQRVSIARAVYDDADIFLFDDPLSALDAEVGANVFKNCIKTRLHDKTRILVTHQLGVLPEVDRVVLMGTAADGSATIIAQGSLDDLLARGYDLSKIVRTSDSEANEKELKKQEEKLELEKKEKLGEIHESSMSKESQSKLSVDYEVALGVSTIAEDGTDMESVSTDHSLPSGTSHDDHSADSGGHSMVGLLLGEEVGLMPAVSAPPIEEGKVSLTLETATFNMNQIQQSERDREIEQAFCHDEDISNIAGIVPPTGGIMDGMKTCKLRAPDGTCIMEEDAHMVAMPTSYELTDRLASEVHDVTTDESEKKEGIEGMKGSSSSFESEKGGKEVSDVNGVFYTSSSTSSSSTSPSFSPNSPVKLKKAEDVKEKPVVKLMTVEERGEGAVGWDVYQGYFKAANRPILIICLLLSFVLGNTSQISQQWIVAAWTSDVGYIKRPLGVYLGGVALMAFSVAFFNWARTLLGVLVGSSASREIHRNMAKQVLGAPLGFFESTPVGRLIQRFSKDLDMIDQQLPSSLGQLLSSSMAIFASMIAITVVTPTFLLAMIPMLAVYVAITNYYRNVARELKRLDSLSRSPIYAHFSETLGGLPVIRSFLRQKMYRRVNEVKLDDNIAAYYSMKAVDRWLSVRLEVLGNSIVFASALLAVFAAPRAGSAGISLNNALSVTSLLNWAVRNGAETESIMNSVERVAYTTTQTPQERASVVGRIPASAFMAAGVPQDYVELLTQHKKINSTITEDASTQIVETALASAVAAVTAAEKGTRTTDTAAAVVPALVQKLQISNTDTADSFTARRYLPTSDAELVASGWPWKGGITLEGVKMRYRKDFEPVLRGVNLQIAPGSSVGIVGRTGSGKSSLFRGLLRLTELEEGVISIDGVDVSQLGLSGLRSGLSIIPQDPVLFSGSIRLNLDPFASYSDEVLWSALRKSNLDQTVRSLKGGLGYEVTEGGENFSSGQRQLLCLARALVRRSRILLLDEATSSVDFETDAIIQQTIRDEFGGGRSTVLTIAHRLDTIMDVDKIMVMDAGQVGEYGSPKELLRNPKSLFAQLVAAEQQQERDGGFKNARKNNEKSSSEVINNNSVGVNDVQGDNLEVMKDSNAVNARDKSLSSLIDSEDTDSKKSVKTAR